MNNREAASTEITTEASRVLIIHTRGSLRERWGTKTYWNFDVLPEPAKAATRIYTYVRMLELESENGPYALCKYLKDWAEEQTYTVRIELQKETKNFRGEIEDQDKWPIVEGRATPDF